MKTHPHTPSHTKSHHTRTHTHTQAHTNAHHHTTTSHPLSPPSPTPSLSSPLSLPPSPLLPSPPLSPPLHNHTHTDHTPTTHQPHTRHTAETDTHTWFLSETRQLPDSVSHGGRGDGKETALPFHRNARKSTRSSLSSGFSHLMRRQHTPCQRRRVTKDRYIALSITQKVLPEAPAPQNKMMSVPTKREAKDSFQLLRSLRGFSLQAHHQP